MTAKVICFASAKGGSGKTVISASLAKFLAALGKKVLLADMDAATNGLSLLYLEELVNARKHLAEKRVSARGIFEATEVKLPTPFSIEGSIDMIPSVYVMKQTEGISEEGFRRLISETLDAFRDKYNYIILDAQAGSDIYAQIAIENADEIVIVSEYDPVSAEGVERLKRLLPKALPPDKTWILFNKILPEFTQSLGDFLRVARYLNPIPWDAEVVRAFARRKLAIDMESGNDYTLAIMQTASSLFGEEIEEETNRWKQNKEESLREPARRQLQAIEEEISLMEEARIRAEYELKRLQRRVENVRMFSITGLLALLAYALLLMFTVIDLSFQIVIAISLGILALGSPIAYYAIRTVEQRSRKGGINLEAQIRALALRLEDLKERRQKYRVITESDLETILKKR